MSSGPTTAAAPDRAPLPPPRAGRTPRGLGASAAICLLALLAATARAGGPEPLRTPGSKQQYLAVVAAWEAKNPAGVVALMPARGALRLVLFTPQVAGSYKAAQATKTLKHYFAQVSDVDLKDVTDKDQRMPQGWAVRKYEYRYTPRGHDPVTTLLTITMQGDGRGTWTLDSIQETTRPTPEQR
jgi:hypothetical protein